MNFLHAWKHAFLMLKPSGITYVLKETFVLMHNACKVLRASWFLIPIGIVIGFCALLGGLFSSTQFYMSALAAAIIASNGAIVLSSVFFLIAARDSSQVKNGTYFKIQLKRVLYHAIVATLIAVIIWIFSIFTIVNMTVKVIAFILSITPYFVDTNILYLLDGYSDAKQRAFTTIWYHYPIYAFYILSMYFFGKAIGYGVHIFLDTVKDVLPVVLVLLLVGIASISLNVCITLFSKCITVSLYNRYKGENI